MCCEHISSLGFNLNRTGVSSTADYRNSMYSISTRYRERATRHRVFGENPQTRTVVFKTFSVSNFTRETYAYPRFVRALRCSARVLRATFENIRCITFALNVTYLSPPPDMNLVCMHCELPDTKLAYARLNGLGLPIVGSSRA